MKAVEENLIAKAKSIYMIGIGGVGMSALARVLSHQGFSVSGSDAKETVRTRELDQEGIPVSIAPNRVSFEKIDLVIYSSAIHTDHLELATARASGVRVCHRAEILASLLNQAKTSVAITGTHGKTTTSSMVSFVLSYLGKQPTCLVGGDVRNFKTNAILGTPDLCISEVDESDQTHELYSPNYAIITNLEEDHMDHYRDWQSLEESFSSFFSNVKSPGVLIYNADDERLSSIVRDSGKPNVSFGIERDADFSAHNIRFTNEGVEFDLFEVGLFEGSFSLAIPGVHNVYNALATIALLVQLGVDLDGVRQALVSFEGAKRRLEVVTQGADFRIIDDYAHHPTEVRATIKALQGLGEKVTVIFQPHRFSRTKRFAKAFAESLKEADEVILTEIYSAGEANPDRVNVSCVYEALIAEGHPNVLVLDKFEIIDEFLSRRGLQGSIAFLGAGDIGEIAHEFASRLKSQPSI